MHSLCLPQSSVINLGQTHIRLINKHATGIFLKFFCSFGANNSNDLFIHGYHSLNPRSTNYRAVFLCKTAVELRKFSAFLTSQPTPTPIAINKSLVFKRCIIRRKSIEWPFPLPRLRRSLGLDQGAPKAREGKRPFN